MIPITKDWAGLKAAKESRSLTINYGTAPNGKALVLYLVSDPFYWTCVLDLCHDEIVTREQVYTETNEYPLASEDLINLQDFEANYEADALLL